MEDISRTNFDSGLNYGSDLAGVSICMQAQMLDTELSVEGSPVMRKVVEAKLDLQHMGSRHAE